MMPQDFVINKDVTESPMPCHQVHTLKHAKQLGIKKIHYVGYYQTCEEAIKEAVSYYPDANGCKECCPNCYKE